MRTAVEYGLVASVITASVITGGLYFILKPAVPPKPAVPSLEDDLIKTAKQLPLTQGVIKPVQGKDYFFVVKKGPPGCNDVEVYHTGSSPSVWDKSVLKRTLCSHGMPARSSIKGFQFNPYAAGIQASPS